MRQLLGVGGRTCAAGRIEQGLAQRVIAHSIRVRSALTLACVPTAGCGREGVHSPAPRWGCSSCVRASWQAGQACAHLRMQTLSSARETLMLFWRNGAGRGASRGSDALLLTALRIQPTPLSFPQTPGVGPNRVFPGSRVESGRPRHGLKPSGFDSEPPILPNPAKTMLTACMPYPFQLS